jgi:hypothetical protein
MADETPDGMAGKFPVKQGTPDDVQTAWKILAGGAPICAASLVHIAEHGKSELARVQASQAVLDRVGLATPKERPSVHFTVIPKEYDEHGIGAAQLSPAEVIRHRLVELKGQTLAIAEAASHGASPEPQPVFDLGDAEVVDAEIMDGDGDWNANPWS